METTGTQPIIFMITIYGGIILGLVYDIYRAVRKIVRSGKWVVVLCDTLFIITLGLIVTFVMYTANQGELRLFTIVGFVLGFTLYMAGLSPFVFYIARKIKGRCNKNKPKE